MSYSLSQLLAICVDKVTGPLFVGLLTGACLFFTLFLGFPQVRYIARAMRMLVGQDKKKSDVTLGKAEASIFQTLATSLGGSIGMGSITGVAIALHVGGPGTLLWMWVLALLAMSTRLAEVFFCHQNRVQDKEGKYHGGPMYYLKNALGKKYMALFYALFTLIVAFLAANATQGNSLAKMLRYSLEVPSLATGLVVSSILGLVIIGGLKRIAEVAERMIPFMTIVYTFLTLYVLTYYWRNIPAAFSAIIQSAWSGQAAVGAFLGSTAWGAAQLGISFGYFASETFTGSSGMVHSAASEKDSKRIGIFSMLEPFITVCFMCTMTAIAILASGKWHEKHETSFEKSAIEILEGTYDEQDTRLRNHIKQVATLPRFSGSLMVVAGQLKDAEAITFLHQRSVAEGVTFFYGKELYTGSLLVHNGELSIDPFLNIRGKSLIKGADLATETFGVNPIAVLLLILCLLLFAFSTVISWSYYGEQALVYLGGGKRMILAYKLLYILAFFLSTLVDAQVVWHLATLVFVGVTLPNLIGLLFAAKRIKKGIEKG